MRLEIEQELKIALYKKIYKYVRRYASVVSSAPHHGPDAVERSDMNIICTDTELQGSTVEPNHAVLLFIAQLFFGEKQMSIHPRSHNHLTRTIYKYKVRTTSVTLVFRIIADGTVVCARSCLRRTRVW